jgi:hypothetical protein
VNFLLYFLIGLVGVAAISKKSHDPKSITEKDMLATVTRALASETDSGVLRKFQYALSNAGYLNEATAIMNRANALDAAEQIEIQKRVESSTQYTGMITALPH